MSLNVSIGDAVPSVGLRATDGYLLNLRSFVSKQPALLLFFGAPTLAGAARRRGLKAIEALVEGHDRLREAGIAIVAISADSEQQQTEFATAQQLPFLLFSDERRSAIEVLGIDTVGDGANVNVARPIGVVVDREGAVRAVLDPVDPASLVDATMRALAEPIPSSRGDAAAPTS